MLNPLSVYTATYAAQSDTEFHKACMAYNTEGAMSKSGPNLAPGPVSRLARMLSWCCPNADPAAAYLLGVCVCVHFKLNTAALRSQCTAYKTKEKSQKEK